MPRKIDKENGKEGRSDLGDFEEEAGLQAMAVFEGIREALRRSRGPEVFLTRAVVVFDGLVKGEEAIGVLSFALPGASMSVPATADLLLDGVGLLVRGAGSADRGPRGDEGGDVDG